MNILFNLSKDKNFMDDDFFIIHKISRDDCSRVDLTNILPREDAGGIERQCEAACEDATQLVEYLQTTRRTSFSANEKDEAWCQLKDLVDAQNSLIRKHLNSLEKLFLNYCDYIPLSEDTIHVLNKLLQRFLYVKLIKAYSTAWCHYLPRAEACAMINRVEECNKQTPPASYTYVQGYENGEILRVLPAKGS